MAMNDARGSVGDLLVLTVLVFAVLAWPLAAPPIGAHGEAREGLVVQDIVQHGRWVLPLRNGELPSKPPFFHWIAAGVGSVVGLSDAVVRLPSALAAWLVVLLVFGLGARPSNARSAAKRPASRPDGVADPRRAAQQRSRDTWSGSAPCGPGAGRFSPRTHYSDGLLGVAAGGRTSGWLAVGALAGMPAFFESASEARVDMLFTASVTLALAGFLRWYRTDDWWARAGCYAAVAAAVLTKGPAGAVLPTLVILVFLARERRLDRVLAFWSWGLAGAVLLVDVGWYALASYTGGADFLARQIFHENVDRFVGRGVFGMHGGRSRLAMVENLATDLLPWNLVLLWAAARWWRGEREDTVGRFLHTWWIVILIFFTAAYGKRGVYLLPLYPAVALLAGRALAAVVARLQADPVSGAHPGFVRALRRVAPERPGRALIAAVVVIDLAVVLVGQIARVQRARRASLAPFARAVAAAVSPTAPLVADRSLDESDLLVMAYRLAREVPRVVEGARCVPGTYRLATPREGTPSASPLVMSTRRGVAVVLVQDTETTCPLALGNEHDR